MRIFASDLDRTLIFSPRFLEDVAVEDCLLVEQIGERPIAYMTKKSYEDLQEIMKNHHFIPVTTRNREEFERVTVFQSLSYAIVNNGGTILKDGEVDKEWEQHIRSQIASLSLNHHQIKEEFEQYYPNQFKISRLSDELLWVFVQAEETELPHFTDVQQTFFEKGWKVEKTGRKVYIIPSFLSKWAAVSFVQKKLGIADVIAAGDSRMDYDLVLGANKSYVPKHGEIAEHGISHASTTVLTGVKAGEEIIAEVKKECKKQVI